MNHLPLGFGRCSSGTEVSIPGAREKLAMRDCIERIFRNEQRLATLDRSHPKRITAIGIFQEPFLTHIVLDIFILRPDYIPVHILPIEQRLLKPAVANKDTYHGLERSQLPGINVALLEKPPACPGNSREIKALYRIL